MVDGPLGAPLLRRDEIVRCGVAVLAHRGALTLWFDVVPVDDQGPVVNPDEVAECRWADPRVVLPRPMFPAVANRLASGAL